MIKKMYIFSSITSHILTIFAIYETAVAISVNNKKPRNITIIQKWCDALFLAKVYNYFHFENKNKKNLNMTESMRKAIVSEK